MPPTAAQRAKIHIAIAELGYSWETYEDILAMNFGTVKKLLRSAKVQSNGTVYSGVVSTLDRDV